MENLPEESNHENGGAKKGMRKKNRRRRLLCELLLDFAKNTTLHGLRYITEQGLSVVEKIFWIITFLTSLGVCLWLMSNVWVKWQTSPVIVTLSEKLMSVTEVPFPAVTICPQAKINQEKINYTEKIIKFYSFIWKTRKANRASNITQTEDEIVQKLIKHDPAIILASNLGLICHKKMFLYESERDDLDIRNVKMINYNAVHHIQQVAPQLEDIFSECSWRDETLDELKDYFTSVLTKEGMCFTFNSLAENEIFHMERIQKKYSYLNASTPQSGWSFSRGYVSSGNHTVYPRRGQANSAQPDLTLGLKEIPDRDVVCDGFNRGFKVYLHHPADLPQSSLYYYSVPPGQVATFAIKVNVMNTSNTLEKYSPLIRQCYFPSEKELRYFKVYTLNNCQLECSANYTLKRCGCVWFHMPHDNSSSICHHAMDECITSALEKHASEDGRNASDCQCLQSCVSVQYEAEVVKTNYDVHTFYKADEEAWDQIFNSVFKANFTFYNEKKYERFKTHSKIEVFFKEPRFMSMRRSELFGLTDFLANCGGLLGLFLGFSFLSLVEIFYFFTLRFTCKLRRNKIAEKNENVAHLKIV